MASLMILTVSMMSMASAHDQDLEAPALESSLFRELAERGEIHIDPREPPVRRDMYWQKRQVGGDSVVPTTTAVESTSTSSPSSAADPPMTSENSSTETATPLSPSAASSSTAISPSITVVTTPLPSPFDTSIGSNFTDSACPQFFSDFLNNATFQSCVPVSLLLQNSNSFFRAERSPTLLGQTLDSACNAPLAICSPLLTNIAAQLIDAANCGQDYKRQNPLVSQAYAGLIAYEPIYRATCLRDANTGNYCFSEAISNSSNSADSYIYYTALGLNMPSSAQPSCTPCLKHTMTIFAGYVENSVQPLSDTYLPSADQIDAGCGTQFVSTTNVKTGSTSHSNGASNIQHRHNSSSSRFTVALAGLAALWSMVLC
ncbi:hypothetical protein A1O3_09236 [Capronia epimyces CBS 606.96]|uniref:DUF7729 domain-containing protein n=1 Tax=Capronia epimyces CBS 606.96 TaxID=1182542 RepID=W9XL74_9EURO|nr:uncharacterized protein A1O3_09236 [Capronia epimyces CBS 606.96]EXJ78075.1 hypothetical protein A1O3_09236 [Capronia epimyces CBS 606.96]